MKDFDIMPIDIVDDKLQIEAWDLAFSKSSLYDSINQFILENGTIRNLGELIDINYEKYPIGKHERKHCFVAKSDKGEILGFLIMTAFDLNTSKPELFIQYVVINPLYQHQGYGNEILTELFSNFKKYIAVKPKNIFAYVHKDNEASKKLFSHFGFTFNAVPKTEYLTASTDGKSLKQNLETQNQKI